MADRDPECIFCKIVAGELPALVVDEDERTVAFLDVNPATPGHTIVVPRRHARDLLDVGAEDLAACVAMAQRVAVRQVDRLRVPGVNVLNNCGAVAGQTVFHLHVHVIPRTDGDAMRLPWIPAPGDPAEIAAVHARLTVETGA